MGSIPGAWTSDRTSLLSRIGDRPLLRRMMERQGIDPTGSWWHGMEGLIERVVHRCAACEHTAECRSWLARSASRATPPSFCSNRHVLPACRTIAADGSSALANNDAESEATLSDMIGDPIVRQLMAADGVDPMDLWQAMTIGPAPASGP